MCECEWNVHVYVCVHKENFCSFMLLRNFAWRLQASLVPPSVPSPSPICTLTSTATPAPHPLPLLALSIKGDRPLLPIHLLWLLSKALSNHIKGNYANIFAAHTSKHTLNLFHPPTPLPHYPVIPPTITQTHSPLSV